MSATKSDRSKWRRRRPSKSPDDDNDCASLAWLLNFRLDEIVNVKVPDGDAAEQELKRSVLDTPPAPKKPPYTYPELIERALRENGELTVSAIYQWISDRFSYYKANDERWKNSVRHNLSINPHFRKGARAPQGAGHLWSLAANAIDLLPLRNSPVYFEESAGEIKEAHVIDCPKDTLYESQTITWKQSPERSDTSKREIRFLNWPEWESNQQPVTWCRVLDHSTAEVAKIGGSNLGKVIVLDEAAIAAASIIPDQELFTGSTMFLNPVSTEQVVRECGLITVD